MSGSQLKSGFVFLLLLGVVLQACKSSRAEVAANNSAQPDESVGGSPPYNSGGMVITLSKQEDGPIRISLLNKGNAAAIIERHSDLDNGLKLKLINQDGSLQEIPKYEPEKYIDYRNLVNDDWIRLETGEGASWLLLEQRTRQLRVGDKVRLTWQVVGFMPEYYVGVAHAFPNGFLKLDLVIQKG